VEWHKKLQAALAKTIETKFGVKFSGILIFAVHKEHNTSDVTYDYLTHCIKKAEQLCSAPSGSMRKRDVEQSGSPRRAHAKWRRPAAGEKVHHGHSLDAQKA
jgi:hypothetical protein